jgi:hypothetical protein
MVKERTIEIFKGKRATNLNTINAIDKKRFIDLLKEVGGKHTSKVS